METKSRGYSEISIQCGTPDAARKDVAGLSLRLLRSNKFGSRAYQLDPEFITGMPLGRGSRRSRLHPAVADPDRAPFAEREAHLLHPG
jgi:hypothetical protein